MPAHHSKHKYNIRPTRALGISLLLVSLLSLPLAYAAPLQKNRLMHHDVTLKLSDKPDKIEQTAARQAANGELSQSMSTLDNAIKSTTSNAYYIFEKAQLLQALEETEEAEKGFVRAWKTGKLSDDCLMHAAWSLHHMGTTQPVLAISTQLIESKPPSKAQATAYFTRARTYVMMGDDNKALLDYEASAKLAPEDAHNQFELGRLYFYKGQPAKAVQCLTKALSKFTTRGEQVNRIYALELRARAFAKQSKFTDAIKDYDEAIKMSPLQRDLYIGRAAIFKSMGEKSKMLADEQKAKSLDKSLDF